MGSQHAIRGCGPGLRVGIGLHELGDGGMTLEERVSCIGGPRILATLLVASSLVPRQQGRAVLVAMRCVGPDAPCKMTQNSC